MAAPLCMFPAAQIAGRVVELGEAIRAALGPGPLTLLGVLKGSALFTADLARAIGGNLELSFVTARSYGPGTTSSGQVVLGELERDAFKGARVIVADTILDTGRTLQRVVAAVGGLGAAEVKSCVLLDKAARRAVPIRADWVGFPVPDCFLVGYGLDAAGQHRALPYVGYLEADE